ncbi:hypothetical protein HGG71_11345 [Rhodobacteraceae bacterium R_SAG2]|nr:hypothetical protein [Rhodobacteraceae bacterium R_SAG2]
MEEIVAGPDNSNEPMLLNAALCVNVGYQKTGEQTNHILFVVELHLQIRLGILLGAVGDISPASCRLPY